MSIEYPKMLYHEDGRTLTVLSSDQEADAEGFTTDPSDIHRDPIASRAPVARVDASGHEDIVEKIIDRMREEFFSSPDETPDRPRRGRPPNVTRQRAGTATIEGNGNG